MRHGGTARNVDHGEVQPPTRTHRFRERSDGLLVRLHDVVTVNRSPPSQHPEGREIALRHVISEHRAGPWAQMVGFERETAGPTLPVSASATAANPHAMGRC
jgi:hypothetical protein